jgi:hypothetical protein
MRDRKDLIKGRGTPYGTDPVRETLFFAFPPGRCVPLALQISLE